VEKDDGTKGTAEGLSPELARLLPSTECPLWWRSAPEGGYALAVYLSPEEGIRTLAHLAKCKNPDQLVRSALLALASEPPTEDYENAMRVLNQKVEKLRR
jgi:hypothetical protein